jgi:hypothetical protein
MGSFERAAHDGAGEARILNELYCIPSARGVLVRPSPWFTPLRSRRQPTIRAHPPTSAAATPWPSRARFYILFSLPRKLLPRPSTPPLTLHPTPDPPPQVLKGSPAVSTTHSLPDLEDFRSSRRLRGRCSAAADACEQGLMMPGKRRGDVLRIKRGSRQPPRDSWSAGSLNACVSIALKKGQGLLSCNVYTYSAARQAAHLGQRCSCGAPSS